MKRIELNYRKAGLSISLICFIMCLLFANASANSPTWKVTQKGNIVRISYGSGSDYPQYAALHLDSSYFRMNYGPTSGWGTSAILLPAFWTKGKYIQGAKIDSTWKTIGADLVLTITGRIDGLKVTGKVRITPPQENMIAAIVKINTEGNIAIDERRGEAFKPVMLSSMHISNDKWDCQAAYIDNRSIQIPKSEWILQTPQSGEVFALQGGTSDWKINAPTIEVSLDQQRWITGWVTESKNPNDDNIGFWAATDTVLSSWEYTIIAKQ